MIGALLLAAALAQAPRAVLAEIEIAGPRSALTLDLVGAGRAELLLAEPLLAGEQRTLSVAVPLSSEPLPEGVWTAAIQRALALGEQGRLLRLQPAVDLGDVPADLLARPRPSLSGRAPRLSWSALFVIGAAFAIALARRHQPLLATAIALLGSGSVLLLTRSLSARPLSSVSLLEANLDADPLLPWLAIECRHARFEPAQLGTAQYETEPRRAKLRCRTRFEPGAESPRVSLEAPGATLFALRRFDPGPRRLSREINAWGNFEAAWLREADGRWIALGAWGLGEALPSGSAGDPPGWLVPPLPMGRSLFLGRFAPGESLEGLPGVDSRAVSERWLRALAL